MQNKMLNTCRICGYTSLDIMPWGSDGKTPSFEICPCCNVQFGYEDNQESSMQKYRDKWIKSTKFNSNDKYLKNLENISPNFL